MHVHPLPHLSTSATPNMSVEQVPLGWTRRHASSMKLFRSSAWVPRQKRGHGYQPASALVREDFCFARARLGGELCLHQARDQQAAPCHPP